MYIYEWETPRRNGCVPIDMCLGFDGSLLKSEMAVDTVDSEQVTVGRGSLTITQTDDMFDIIG